MEIDFSEYSYAELIQARQSIDEYQYPQRTKQLDAYILERQGDSHLTTEEVLFDKYSTFGARFVASIVDSLVITAVFMTVSFVALSITEQLASIVELLEHLAFVTYSVLLHGLFGQTIGKMITEVKVVDVLTEGPISFKQAVIRDCVPILASLFVVGISAYIIVFGISEEDKTWIVSSLYGFGLALIGWHLLEIISMLFNDKRRAIHDFLAGTVVVHVE